jgi:hypothetical protein
MISAKCFNYSFKVWYQSFYRRKTLSIKRNLFSLIVAFVMLVGMIPLAAIPVSAAAGDHLVMSLVDPRNGQTNGPDSGYNITGSIVEVTAVTSAGVALPGTAINGWSLLQVVPVSTNAQFVPNGPKLGVNPVRVQGDWGEAIIQCTLTDGSTLSINKKWGKMNATVITPPQSTYVTWVEADKSWIGGAQVTDTVTGIFINEFGATTIAPAQGVIFNWWLLHGNPTIVPPAVKEAPNWIAVFNGLQPAIFANFVGDGTFVQTVSDGSGASGVKIVTNGEEAITVVVVPQYPVPIQLDVVPEYTTINFWTREMEKVPQVRWAGEKIVLEKNWGTGFVGMPVSFSLENQSPGALEAINLYTGPTDNGVLGMGLSDSQRVWTTVDANGLASVIVISEDPGEVDVDCAIYLRGTTIPGPNYYLANQHGFVVYYLKLEELKLSNIVGKRDGHNIGDWTIPGATPPSNPWDPTKDVLEETLNVSQDTLLRALVKGWFLNANPSMRPERELDINNDGIPELLLPRGRWVLPDDWAALAGPNWKQNRIHWDIMDAPNDSVRASTPLGSYNTVNGNTTQNVIGPFSPGIELMTPLGWNVQFSSPDPARVMRTVVPNGELNAWDAPMPPAKIIFEILNKSVTANFPNGSQEIGNSGFFKEADKAGIYYIGSSYTNPFYAEMIPAHQAIPAFINNGGYDWDAFDTTHYGAYVFWTIINRPDLNAAVPTDDPANHPTKVEVYSDNHGEAMVYLNGDWNLNLMGFNVNGAADVPYGATVGSTTVQAMADYPYLRKHQPILSNTVKKTWIWGGKVLGTDGVSYLDGSVQPASLIINTTGNYTITTPGGPNFPDDVGTSNKKMVWLWLTDRDGMQKGVLNAKVAWRITGGGNSVFISTAGGMLSNYNPTMQNITLQNGFLAGTTGTKVAGSGDTQGVSYTKKPTTYEMDLFKKYYPGIDAENFVVAGIEIMTSGPLLDVGVFMDITAPDFDGGFGVPTINRTANVDFAQAYPLDDQILMGDANVDGTINMGDVTAIEMAILGLITKNVNADSNGDGVVNMADVIRNERTILGLP